MNYFIIGFVVLSIIGSVMWVMPTPRDRFLAALRMEAKKIGFQVQLIKLTYPREKGVLDLRQVSTVVYRLLRGKIDNQTHHEWLSWRVVRCETNACEGLELGWGWALGERTLSAQQLLKINEVLKAMPESVIAVESTPVHASVFWKEKSQQEMIDIEQQLKLLIEYVV